MRSHHSTAFIARTLVVATVLAGSASALSAQSTGYTIQDLSPDETSSSSAVAINDDGIIAGSSEASRITRAVHTRSGTPFFWVPGLQFIASAASGVNAGGDLTGYMQVTTDPWRVDAFRYTAAGGVVSLGGLGGDSYGVAINRWGHVVGWSYYGSTSDAHAFLAKPGQSMQDLGTLSGAGSSFAAGINDAGQIALHSQTGEGRWLAFRLTPGWEQQDVGTPPDASTFAAGINASGQVVGRMIRPGVGTRAYRYTDGVGLEDLHTTAGGTSAAEGINDAGTVVGYLFAPGASTAHAFVYTDGEGMVDLNTRIDPRAGWVLNVASGINSAGEIVGQGRYGADPKPRAFKLTPRPLDVTAPEITAAVADRAYLWPANLQMIPVTISVSVTDDLDPAPLCRIVSVTSSELVDGAATQLTGDLTLALRAERYGSGDGRTYRVGVTCTDATGNTANADVDIRVPHDRPAGQ
jgi:probable HAF family extracellular repeat protein